MSGIDLRRRPTVLDSRLPIIFITGVDDAAVRKEAMKAGCVAYLRKTCRAPLLIVTIDKATS
jgi:FixJ family two-component response regulator